MKNEEFIYSNLTVNVTFALKSFSMKLKFKFSPLNSNTPYCRFTEIFPQPVLLPYLPPPPIIPDSRAY